MIRRDLCSVQAGPGFLLRAGRLVRDLGKVPAPLLGREGGRAAYPADGVAGVEIPELDAAVEARGRENALPAEGRRFGDAAGTRGCLAVRPGPLGVSDVPQCDRAIVIDDGQCLPVRGERR